MRAGNFAYLKTLKNNSDDTHLMTNFMKRVLRAMKEPLIPYDLYEKFG